MTTQDGDGNPGDIVAEGARKDFARFPETAQIEMGRALTIVAEGGHPDIQKKSRSGIKAPKAEMDLIGERLMRLQEALR